MPVGQDQIASNTGGTFPKPECFHKHSICELFIQGNLIWKFSAARIPATPLRLWCPQQKQLEKFASRS